MIQIIGTLLLIGLLALTAISPDVINLRNFGPNDIIQLLTVIAGVATLEQSTVEVMISTWRNPAREEIEAELMRLNRELKGENITPDERKQWIAERKELRIKLKKYKADTRRISLWIALLVGILISVVGVRILGNLVDPNQLQAMSKYQALGFNTMDIFLTGALIAGGADGVYQIVQVFSSFLNKTDEKVKAN